MFLVIALAVVAAAVFGGFYYWARRHELPPTERSQGGRRTRRISLLTEAVAYVGAILLLAGAIGAIGQRWDSIGDWGHVGVFAGAAVFFLLVGIAVRRVQEPAIQRFLGIAWFLSVAGVAGAVAFATLNERGNPSTYTAVAVGVAVTVYSAALWLIRRSALQNVALFAGLVVTIVGAIVAIDESASPLVFIFALWVFGLLWAGLGWRRHVEPMWVTIPLGGVLALLAPTFALGEYGWLYAIGIATAAAAMAGSVPLRNTPLLGMGTLAMFGYVTSVVVRYFGDSLGVPAALAITGVLIIGLAVLTARLMRATRPPTPKEPGGGPPRAAPLRKPEDGRKPSDRDLPKAS